MTLWPWLALHGDVKSFFVGTIPYDGVLFPDPVAQGIADGRLKLEARSERVDADVHHAVSAIAGGVTSFTTSTGLARTAPEAVELSWVALDDAGFQLRGRTDRLAATVHAGPVDLGLGRQPITFGAGLFFTPMDLVAPFVPTTIDQEYKPGVDAVRVDGYTGTAGKVTAVAAYAGDWDVQGVVVAGHGQATVGVTDLRLFLGEVHADEVVGLGTTTSVGPVGVHADATVTLPDGGADPFVRAVLGSTVKPAVKLTMFGELYVQTNGRVDPDEYLLAGLDPRYARGELWALGRYYAAASAAYELTPLVSPSVAVIANATDPSLLVTGSLSWSVGDDAVVGVGANGGLGARPTRTALQSEFGTYPVSVFVNMKAYF